ncbi:phospho-N-acetylmuramoyl-pentapeptide-transferase [Angustibacter aerolatus]|uniref:Phospho-N-acetylmuramoyl-pentapeptide-transferase n=1 Tax=Angustibacter aerolatus TaxID=1162965 RepID=A0ABQ6JB58_9ACTN|nr:phospho-N-acetylmuramoyl-pentapeptide-transferase [Angustibacter aerolatus]GMA85423.1 phospho-N-acetylmuramoyl-pentapeptide-transferase [Angustibacter aerolatus]
MKAVLFAAGVSLLVTLLGTPLYIRFLVKRAYGQFVRDDGPTSHHTKRGTPTMGGAVIIGGTLAAYVAAHLLTWRPPTVSGLLVLFLMTGLGFIGFLDDFIKIRNQRSLGLRAVPRLIGQSLVSVVFAVLALQFPNHAFRTPASTQISFIRDTPLDLAFAGPALGLALFVVWAYVLIAATSNGVNLTDGLDGLATGASTLVFAAFVLIGTWQSNQACQTLQTGTPSSTALKCYEVRDPRDLAVVAACVMGSCIGFLWWNASPARIFMGDTGSLALGGALAGLAITSRTEVLLVIIAGLFVIITMSVILQVGSFKADRQADLPDGAAAAPLRACWGGRRSPS